MNWLIREKCSPILVCCIANMTTIELSVNNLTHPRFQNVVFCKWWKKFDGRLSLLTNILPPSRGLMLCPEDKGGRLLGSVGKH